MNIEKNYVYKIFYEVFYTDRDLQTSATDADEENHVEPSGQLTVVGGHTESTTAAAAVAGVRSARQYYQPAAAFGYQPYPQRRAYVGPKKKRRPMRTKSGRRPKPRRRPGAVGPQSAMGRFRRLPPPMRPQHMNYVDPAAVDYEDGFESAPQSMSFDYGEREFVDHEPAAAAYLYGSAMDPAGPMAVMTTSGRSRKRPVTAYVDEQPQSSAVVHLPVRVAMRPVPAQPTTPTTTTTVVTADPMEKLRQLVHEAMDEHFANRHQELYTDGFDKQQPSHQHVYSAKYKRHQDKDKHPQQRTADAVKSLTTTTTSSTGTKRDVPSDADALGSDDRLTLAEISAYMGAKPAETVLSAGGHRYVLSDALQHSYRNHQQPQQQYQQQQYGVGGGGEDQQQYLRYVSPFEAIYELPAARWTYK